MNNTPNRTPEPEALREGRKSGQTMSVHDLFRHLPIWKAGELAEHARVIQVSDVQGKFPATAEVTANAELVAAIKTAQRMLSAWNEWYGRNGAGLPLPPAGIVRAQDSLAEAMSIVSGGAAPVHEEPVRMDWNRLAALTQAGGSQ